MLADRVTTTYMGVCDIVQGLGVTWLPRGEKAPRHVTEEPGVWEA